MEEEEWLRRQARLGLQASVNRGSAFIQPAERPLWLCDTCQLRFIHKALQTHSCKCHGEGNFKMQELKQNKGGMFLAE